MLTRKKKSHSTEQNSHPCRKRRKVFSSDGNYLRKEREKKLRGEVEKKALPSHEI